MTLGIYDYTGTDENDLFIAGDNVEEGTEGAVSYTFGEETYHVLLTDTDAEIRGLGGSDTLVGGNGNDSIYGGQGEDYLMGNLGSDIFAFEEGDGYNVIADSDKFDKIQFLTGEDFSGITFTRGNSESGQDETSLYINYSENEDDIIEVQGYFAQDGTSKADCINTFVVNNIDYTLAWKYTEQTQSSRMYNIPDGEETVVNGIPNWLVADEETEELVGTDSDDMLIGTSGDNKIYGSDGADIILGKEGQDRLYGEDGDDILDSGKGNDDITGGDGNNTYIFRVGDGTDVIYNAKYGDKIKFVDVLFEDLVFEKVPALDEQENPIANTFDLKITYGDEENPDTVIIKNFSFNVTSLENNNIDNITALKRGVPNAEQDEEDEAPLVEENYSILSDAGIIIPSILGSAYSEIITGTDKNDGIYSGGGNDTISGGTGKDTFNIPNPNTEGVVAGHVVIEDAKSEDTIKFLNTRFDDLSFAINPDSKDLVITNGENSSVTVKNFLTGQKFFDRLLVLNENPEVITEYTAKSIADNAQITVYMDKGATYYKGNSLNETITSTAADEDFTMGRGSNEIRILTDNLFGDDTVNLTKDEKLNILFLKTVEGELVQDFSFNATVSGNDVVFYHNKGSLTIKNAIIRDVGADIFVNDSDIRKRPLIKFDEMNVNKKGEIIGSVLADFVNLENYVSKNGKTGVKVTTGTGDDTVDGSSYNDTITAAFGDNLIYEDGGNNKITTGAGNDIITVTAYSSNVIKAGAGLNEINLQSTGTNKVTAGAETDTLNIVSGTNTVNLYGGENIVNINGEYSTNTITTGDNADTYNIKAGVNTIKTGKGNDNLTIEGGYNTITTSGIERQIDLFNITGGINSIKSSKGNDKFIIKDKVYEDEEGAEIHTYGGKNYLNGMQGNDLYQVDKAVYDNSSVQITDNYGTNTLVINQKLDVFFDVKINKKTGKYTIGKTVTFTDGFDSDDDGIFDTRSLNTGISVTGKSAKAISYVIVDVDNEDGSKDYRYKFDVTKLASDVASWLTENRYYSTQSVFDSGNKDLINSLLTVYKGDNGQTDLGSDQCYRNGVDVTPYV